MANGLDFKFKLPTDAELDRMLNMGPKLKQYQVADKAVTAAATVLVERAKALTPRGDLTGNSAKRSQKQRAEADWDYPLHKAIKKVTRRYDRASVAVVGPEWPKGNKAYFNTSPKGRVQWFWGRKTGAIVPQIRNWIVQAFDETKPMQLSAMKASITKTVDAMMRNK